MKLKKEKLIIIDGNALIHRSFHALPPTMITKAGEMTNAVYGFASVLIKALREFKPDYVFLTLDKKGPTFRHEAYTEYKANRVAAPDDLYKQIPRVKEIARAFNIPIYEMSGFEADDLIGTIAKKTDGQIEKIIVTGDMDTLQLVNDHTKVFTMSRGLTDSVIYDEFKVKERYGLVPDQIIDYKALRGDPSDNIPGVKGIGEKTATELLQEFKTLDNLYEAIDNDKTGNKIRPRIVALLKQHKDDAFLSHKLATIKCDVKIDFDLAAGKFGNFDFKNVVKLLSELEFKSLLARVKEIKHEGSGGAEESSDKFTRDKNLFKYELIDDEKKFDEFFKKLEKEKEFVFDTETTGLDPLTCDLLGVSFSWKEGEARYVQLQTHLIPPTGAPLLNRRGELRVAGDEMGGKKDNLFNYQDEVKVESQKHAPSIPEGSKACPEYSRRVKSYLWLEKLKPIFEDEKIKKIAHNIKFDTRVLNNYGIEIKGANFDTMIAAYLLDPGKRQYNLDSQTFSEFGFEKISKENLLGEGKNKIEFGEVSVEKLYVYSCEDADFTFRLKEKLQAELIKQKLEDLFTKIEMPLVPVLVKMENNGIKINKDSLEELGQEVNQKIKNLEKKIHAEARSDFNINSTQQLREILFDKLGILSEGVGRNKTGFSTSAEELEKIKHLHPIVPLIQEYRELAKLSNTYIKALPLLINPRTTRIHTSYNQTIAATGRLSSAEPNLQNIPARTELGSKIRRAFIAEKGCKLLSLDYSQIELRLAAHMSEDKKMIKAFQDNEDIHTATAAEINEVALNDVTAEMRREAKAINFGILYGQGPYGLSQSANIPMARAKDFIDKYFSLFSDVKKYIDETIADAREKEYVETLFGRRRYLPEINSSVVQLKKGAERMAVNTPIQGTAADMIKLAMIEVFKIIDNQEIKILLTVHDELIFEVKSDLAAKWAERIKKIMQEVIKLKVPIIADAKIGDNWEEMEEVD